MSMRALRCGECMDPLTWRDDKVRCTSAGGADHDAPRRGVEADAGDGFEPCSDRVSGSVAVAFVVEVAAVVAEGCFGP